MLPGRRRTRARERLSWHSRCATRARRSWRAVLATRSAAEPTVVAALISRNCAAADRVLLDDRRLAQALLDRRSTVAASEGAERTSDASNAGTEDGGHRRPVAGNVVAPGVGLLVSARRPSHVHDARPLGSRVQRALLPRRCGSGGTRLSAAVALSAPSSAPPPLGVVDEGPRHRSSTAPATEIT